jgi:2'-5' RNA ligase
MRPHQNRSESSEHADGYGYRSDYRDRPRLRTLLLAVIPPEPQRTILLRMMEDWCEQVGSQKPLHLPPHISIVGRFKTATAAKLLARIAQYCATTRCFDVTLSRATHFDQPKMLYAAPDEQSVANLAQIHRELLEIVTPLREPWNRFEQDKSERTPRQRELLERYGSPYVLELYVPHLTLAGSDVDDRFEEATTRIHLEEPITFSIGSIAVLEKTDEWRLLDEIPLER